MTADPELPVDIQDFLRRHVTSHDQVKLLLALSENGTRWWTLAQLATLIDASPQDLLAPLVDRGVLVAQSSESEIAYRFAPVRPEHVHLLTRLRDLSEQSALPLLRAVTAHAIERIRAEARRTFSEVLLEGDAPKDD